MHHQPLVSVLLPVYNGEKYLNAAITSILNQSDQDYELIISIDSSTDGSEEVARRFEDIDQRVKVFTHTRRLGMRGNYDFLVGKANGSWLTILGQDDAMMPFAISQLRKAIDKEKCISVLVSRRAYAFWPDTNGDFGRNQFIYPIGRNRVSKVLSRKFLIDCLKGKSEYSQGPQLYTGSFVSRTVITEFLTSQKGELFPYPIPDVSSSASILLATENFHFSNLPLFIVGTSGSSTGVLIDNSLKSSDSRAAIQKLYLESFNGDREKFKTPGLGVFSSFSWYLFEAVSIIASSDQLSRLSFNSSWALAALKVENRRKIRKQDDLKGIISNVKNQLSIDRLSLEIKVVIIHLFKLWNLFWKYVTGFSLFIQFRLILEPTSNKFDMIEFINIASAKSNVRQFKKVK
jgi:glycosyltransferase involved in cell wall biosynthesis